MKETATCGAFFIGVYQLDYRGRAGIMRNMFYIINI